FLSMYPTVCTLMGLWRFVIAKSLVWEKASAGEAQAYLANVTANDMRRPEAWPDLAMLVQIQPEADILPVRAPYDGGSSYTIGLNYLTSRQPLWYTLADCIASTTLAGKPPKVLRALRFRPDGMQDGLRPLTLLGESDYTVDPR
ncbi:MAG TPA: hypothetical protein VHI51_00180, partial [Ktedonobacterales bacterium]|nr:hypothetical protein [Ktedonobacterales bacterium]